MSNVILKAHYDGESIVLDEPYELLPNTSLVVTVLPQEVGQTGSERSAWAEFSAQSLARAYGDTEPEYTLDDLQP